MSRRPIPDAPSLVGFFFLEKHAADGGRGPLVVSLRRGELDPVLLLALAPAPSSLYALVASLRIRGTVAKRLDTLAEVEDLLNLVPVNVIVGVDPSLDDDVCLFQRLIFHPEAAPDGGLPGGFELASELRSFRALEDAPAKRRPRMPGTFVRGGKRKRKGGAS